MIKGLGHIGIAVKDMEKALEAVVRSLGVAMPPIREIFQI